MPTTTNAPLTPDQQITALQQIVHALNLQIDGLKAQLAAQQAPLQAKYVQALTAQYDEQIALLRATAELYRWQNFASTVMMWTAVAVVLSGLLFAGYQLYYSVRLDRRTDGTLELSAQRLKLTSSVVGVVILAMSIAFVLIFVGKVYTITSASPAAVAAPGSLPAPAHEERSR